MLYQWTKLQCHTLFPSQDITQNVLLSSYLDRYDVLNFFFFNQPLKQWLTGKKIGEGENTKI